MTAETTLEEAYNIKRLIVLLNPGRGEACPARKRAIWEEGPESGLQQAGGRECGDRGQRAFTRDLGGAQKQKVCWSFMGVFQCHWVTIRGVQDGEPVARTSLMTPMPLVTWAQYS